MQSVSLIVDCESPAIIAPAAHSGHRYAMEVNGDVAELSYLPMALST